MRRMNGLCRGMAGVLLLCALLFSSKVMCEEASTANPSTTLSDSAYIFVDAGTVNPATPDPAVPQNPVSSGDSADSTAVLAVVTTNIPDVPEGGTTKKTQTTGSMGIAVNVSGGNKPNDQASSGSSVFVGILVTGLLAALGIIVGYFKCQRRPDPKGAMLAEEACPVDQENQGNTLASDAPLNPPQETQEKPSVNGESLEAVKTETSPPTNGHSTAKTADTEL